MNTRQLQYVITLAEEKSFSDAAGKLLISQPSLSQYIQKLEKELGTELFERTVPLRLTYAGETYVECAKKILNIENELTERINDISEEKSGKINIGVGFLNSLTLIPKLVSLYHNQYPRVEIVIHEDIEPNLKLMADAGDVDIVISTSKFDDGRYEGIELFSEEFLLAVPKSMIPEKTLFDKIESSGKHAIRTVTIDEIQDVPMVMLSSSTYIYAIIEEVFKKGKTAPKVAATCTTAYGAYGMTKAGVGATLIPYSTYMNDYSANIEYYRIQNNLNRRTVGLYYNKDRYIPKVMEKFIKVSIEFFKEENII